MSSQNRIFNWIFSILFLFHASINFAQVGFWNMDANQITGNIMQDQTVNDHDGTISGATSIAGVNNEALDFSSPTTSEVSITADGVLNIQTNITIMAWVNWKGSNFPAASGQTFIGRGADWTFNITNGGKPSFYSSAISNGLSSDTGVPTNQWQLLTFTYDGQTMKIYLDAAEVATKQVTGNLGTSISTLFIGKGSSNNTSFYGSIDEAQIFNTVLTQMEIQTIFDAAPLAVVWESPLSAFQQKDKVILTWSVAQQVNNEKFVIEHSQNGKTFLPINRISGDGDYLQEKVFQFTHLAPGIGGNYYRIKQVDYDGKYEYSNIAFARFNAQAINIYPNPVQHQLFFSQAVNAKQVGIYDLAGKLMLAPFVNENSIHINSLPKGTYVLKIINNGQASQVLFIKE